MRSSSAYNMGDNEHCGLFHTRVSPRGGGGGGGGEGKEGGKESSWQHHGRVTLLLRLKNSHLC